MTGMTTREIVRAESAIIRAGAHAAAEAVLRPAQTFRHKVTDLDVARVFRGLEAGTKPFTNRTGKWFAPAGSPMHGMRTHLSHTIAEMIRTGLVRHYRDHYGDHLIPALVHFRNLTDRNLSACLFTGEDMGPMRARLVDRLDLVDCLMCESAIATGSVRPL